MGYKRIVLLVSLMACSCLTSALASPPVTPPPASGNQANAAVAHPQLWPLAQSPQAFRTPALEARVSQLLASLTLEEKIGQMIQADISSITPADLAQFPLGSIIAGGNSAPSGNDYATPGAWVDLIRSFRAAALKRSGTKIPLIFGIDAVHGHNNVVGATIFPHNIGLGAANDRELIGEIARVTALEAAATGVDWTFGPTLAVPRDDRWGRTYEGFSEDPKIIASYASAITLGLQGTLVPDAPMKPGFIAGSAKHFLADGGTKGGKDQGDASISEEELIHIHAAGYPPAINAGILSIMISFSSWQGVKHSANQSLLEGVVKKRMGFDGFLVSDWNAHGQVQGCSNMSCPQAFNAGLDMLMAPDSWRGLYLNTLTQARAGEIPMSRIDDAVTRILRAKILAGLFEPNHARLEGQFSLLGAPEHRQLARQAVRESLVLLKNNNATLPIASTANVLVAGSGADDISMQSGGWTLTWQGTGNTNANFPNGQSIWSGLSEALKAEGGRATLSVSGTYNQKPDVAIVVFGERPYAEFQGDLEHLDFKSEGDKDLKLMRKLKADGIPVVAVFLSGRPMWVNPELNASDAFVAAWLPGSEGGGLADVLIGTPKKTPRYDFKGKLSFSWPASPTQTPLNVGDPTYNPLFAYGFGLTYTSVNLLGPLSEDGVTMETSRRELFMRGQPIAPWSLILSDRTGDTRTTSSTGASPGTSVQMTPIDTNAQEAGRAISFSGTGGSVFITGPAADFSQPAQQGWVLSFKVNTRANTPSGANFGMNGKEFKLIDILPSSTDGTWRPIMVPLSCFAAAGIDLTHVHEPLRFSANTAWDLSFSDVQLSPSTGKPSPCPMVSK
ncbi:glycoside hydrolase family 3 protein [Candidatus Phycosocius spiralis]|uniref:1,4-beta-D-glucan glucohydrolase n=1 Tax=Candidatus Phycosocius spiralis TaxID=2815099 RepID=A0ABQ4PXR9_9PROT|nr:glycoside hydrolase family 3 protein [Candidatus Phycosocius spiralis]GIU67812.1 1,4-beta-D-glucan glucohydrolase [Candidatus Phycosocius spiralis]